MTSNDLNQHTTGAALERLAAIIAQLRSPQGCPWDREQTSASIARNMIEEAYEAVSAIERGDTAGLREELGDVLLQVVFQAQLATEAQEFTLADVVNDISDKLVRRHPHVFGEDAACAAAHLSPERAQLLQEATTAAKVLDLWDLIKLQEKEDKAARHAAGASLPPGLLDSVPDALPALMQAQDISRKAVASGFEWESVSDVLDQLVSEVREFTAEPPGSLEAAEEFGDVLFTLVNVARKSNVDAESALRGTCRKFRRRWAIMEKHARDAGKPLETYSTEQLEALWQAAKKEEQ
ncbi:MAG: nucleoside triphosphate pyrophosphohydrolase [Coriobacteriales bacterium]|jgi:tetrapyrrole methylase family protein/MazG family protein|nr:nucleoside triphosphate pyrophosphohydrolase [Coriobacteriales bacterium]